MMAEKNDRNRIANFSKRALSLRSGLVYGLFALLLAVALTGGMTSAWFTSGDNTENTFTAGTLDIDATGPYDFDGTGYTQSADIVFEPCASLSYLITNQGTKTAYVRAKFEGHWLRGYHENKASATVNFNGDIISAADSAHFNYPDGIQSEPTYNAENTDEAFGFTDQLLLGPVQFEPLPLQNGALDSGYDFVGLPRYFSFNGNQNNIIEPITAPGEKFSFVAASIANLSAGLLNDLFGPSCLLSDGFKLKYPGTVTDISSENMSAGTSITLTDDDNNVDFSITITKNQNNTFNFVSNNPKYKIYHVYAKGGNGSNIYTYYVDAGKVVIAGDNQNYVSTAQVAMVHPSNNPFLPSITWVSSQYNKAEERVYLDLNKLSPNGVYKGFELEAATGAGWSHITVYYCEVQIVADPSLEIVKLVKVEENGLWYTSQIFKDREIISALIDNGYSIGFYDYSNKSTWRVATGNVPRFIIAVANTGNVALNQVQISDDYFEGINQEIGTLNPGQLWISETIEYTGYRDPLSLSTDVISVKIDPLSQNDWIPYPVAQDLGDYFYYNKIIAADSNINIPLHIQVCLDDESLNKKYSGAVFKLYAFFEAVQTTNGLVEINWLYNPY